MPLNQTFHDDFGREFALQLWSPTKVSVVAHGVATILTGDAAERIATFMRGTEDECEEALRQQVEEELQKAGLLIYNEDEGEWQSNVAYDEWKADCDAELSHRRELSDPRLYL